MKVLEKVKLREQVIESITQAIVDGKYKIDDRLPSVSELASELGVSITSVRDALMQLEAVGLIDIKQGKGVFIKEIGPDFFSTRLSSMLLLERSELFDLVEVRKTIEVECARLAAERRSNDDLRQLREIMVRMKAALEDPDAYLNEDLTLHMTIAKASGNSIFPKILQLLESPFLSELRRTIRQPGTIETGFKHHSAIVAAIESGDSQRAADSMIEHLQYTKQVLKSMI